MQIIATLPLFLQIIATPPLFLQIIATLPLFCKSLWHFHFFANHSDISTFFANQNDTSTFFGSGPCTTGRNSGLRIWNTMRDEQTKTNKQWKLDGWVSPLCQFYFFSVDLQRCAPGVGKCVQHCHQAGFHSQWGETRIMSKKRPNCINLLLCYPSNHLQCQFEMRHSITIQGTARNKDVDAKATHWWAGEQVSFILILIKGEAIRSKERMSFYTKV